MSHDVHWFLGGVCTQLTISLVLTSYMFLLNVRTPKYGSYYCIIFQSTQKTSHVWCCFKNSIISSKFLMCICAKLQQQKVISRSIVLVYPILSFSEYCIIILSLSVSFASLAFKTLGKLIFDVGLMVAYHCDRYGKLSIQE